MRKDTLFRLRIVVIMHRQRRLPTISVQHLWKKRLLLFKLNWSEREGDDKLLPAMNEETSHNECECVCGVFVSLSRQTRVKNLINGIRRRRTRNKNTGVNKHKQEKQSRFIFFSLSFFFLKKWTRSLLFSKLDFWTRNRKRENRLVCVST